MSANEKLSSASPSAISIEAEAGSPEAVLTCIDVAKDDAVAELVAVLKVVHLKFKRRTRTQIMTLEHPPNLSSPSLAKIEEGGKIMSKRTRSKEQLGNR